MIKKILFCFAFILTSQAIAAENFNSKEGITRLERAELKEDFYQLINFYQAQINPFYCSIATSVTILNAINYQENKALPFSQQTFLSEKTDKIKSQKIIRREEKNEEGNYDEGLSLLDLSKILQSYKLDTKLTYVEKNDETSIAKFRSEIRNALQNKNIFLVANFDGKTLGRKTNGHFSPVVAYDEKSDSVLVMDVALYKNQWFWASVPDLTGAMNTKDGENYRGYLLVENH